MFNIRLTIAYDGTSYFGWQTTNIGPSVEEALKNTIEKIVQEKVVLQAASRTDAGVHALGQVVNFFCSKKINANKLLVSLNSLLPNDICILTADIVDQNFHPTLDNCGKVYHYFVCYGFFQIPQNRAFSWHYPHHLDIENMREAAKNFVGIHDFSSLCNSKEKNCNKNYVRHVSEISIEQPSTHRILFKIRGKSFLYKMVRNIVGTLVYAGHGKIKVDDVSHILSAKERTQAGVTAPAHGLTLFEVIY